MECFHLKIQAIIRGKRKLTNKSHLQLGAKDCEETTNYSSNETIKDPLWHNGSTGCLDYVDTTSSSLSINNNQNQQIIDFNGATPNWLPLSYTNRWGSGPRCSIICKDTLYLHINWIMQKFSYYNCISLVSSKLLPPTAAIVRNQPHRQNLQPLKYSQTYI